jgi:hypothetical protein
LYDFERVLIVDKVLFDDSVDAACRNVRSFDVSKLIAISLVDIVAYAFMIFIPKELVTVST